MIPEGASDLCRTERGERGTSPSTEGGETRPPGLSAYPDRSLAVDTATGSIQVEASKQKKRRGHELRRRMLEMFGGWGCRFSVPTRSQIPD